MEHLQLLPIAAPCRGIFAFVVHQMDMGHGRHLNFGKSFSGGRTREDPLFLVSRPWTARDAPVLRLPHVVDAAAKSRPHMAGYPHCAGRQAARLVTLRRAAASAACPGVTACGPATILSSMTREPLVQRPTRPTMKIATRAPSGWKKWWGSGTCLPG